MLFPEENQKIDGHIRGMHFYAFSNDTISLPATVGNDQTDVINFEKEYWIAITKIKAYVSTDNFNFQYQILINGADRVIFENAVFAESYFRQFPRTCIAAPEGQHLENRLPIPWIISPKANLTFTFTQQIAVAYDIKMVYDGVRFETFDQMNAIFKYNSQDN